MYSKHKPYLTANTTLATTTTTTTAAVEDDNGIPTTTTANAATATTPSSSSPTISGETSVEEKKLELTLSKQSVDKQWNLLGPYLGQYIVYTGKSNAWLLS